MGAEPASLDRRQRRRLETIEEVLDAAVDVMAEQGVAGLSLGEVARRVGVRPPSLYVYFPSKHAVYDALFLRGATDLLQTLRAGGFFDLDPTRPLEQTLLDAATVFARWAVEHPMYSQLLFWRPVPGFTPSEQAYAPAVELVADTQARFRALQEHGLIRADVAVEDVSRDWTVVIGGVVSQQLSNAPDEPFDTGTFTSRLPAAVAMFTRYYSAPPQPTRRTRRASSR